MDLRAAERRALGRVFGRVSVAFGLSAALIVAATPSTVEAALTVTTVGLQTPGSKEGGLTWGDFNDDGCLDALVNTNNAGGSAPYTRLYRSNCSLPNPSFTDVTASLAAQLDDRNTPRTALFGDLNNDGYLDIVVNTFTQIEVYFNNGPGSGYTFGNPAPDVIINSVPGGLNSEGLGLIDYDGNGTLDLIIENHNYGIDVFSNNGSGGLTFVDPATIGLPLTATTGDYSAVADFDGDGDVDFLARKQDQLDLWVNGGGTFAANASFNQQAINNNKGGVAFCDFDNDGDFDIYWTDNGTNQIWRNDSSTFAATGLPAGAPATGVEGVACGDTDNDGDVDLVLTGTAGVQLFENTSGGSLSFAAPTTVTSGNAMSAAFGDYDRDGDVDLLANINGGNNALARNDAVQTGNSDYIVLRALHRNPNSSLRDAIGATIRVETCAGAVIGGIREVSGGSGRGSQGAAYVHTGLVSGSDVTYVFRYRFPTGETVSRAIVPSSLDPAYRLLEVANTDATDLTACAAVPNAVDDTASTTEETAVTVDVVDNDSDPDGDLDPTSVSVTSAPGNGSVTGIDALTGEITYLPAAGFVGIDTFEYEICDLTAPTPLCDTATVTVTVTDEGDPDAADDTASVTEDTTTATVINAIGNDTLTDDATYLAGSLDTTGTTGTVVDNGDGTFDYTPAPAFAGDDSFTYEICDDDTPTATCDTGTVTVTVVDEGDPNAIDDTTSVTEDTTTATTVDAIGNDTLTDDATYLAGSLDTTGTTGTVVDNGDGTFDYTPAPAFAGDDSFTYEICDDDTPTATCDTATVTVTVVDEGSPDAVNDTDSVTEDTTTATVIDAIGNDTLTDDATYLAGSLDTTGTTGTIVDNGDGTFDYTPAPGFSGDDSFTYTICDDDTPATCDTATVTVTVVDEGDPDAIDDTANVVEDTTTATLIDAIGNDTLTDDATYLAGSLDTTGTVGTVGDNGDGTFDYTPAPGFVGDDSFTYTICDDDTPTATCDTATVTVTVTDEGSPDAIDDNVSIPEDTTTPTVIDAIANDTLTDNATYLAGSLDTTGTVGTVVDNGDGTFDYTPAPGFTGDDSFTYTICDDDTPIPTCDTVAATVTVTVVDEGDPDAVNDTANVVEDTTTATLIDAIGNDTLTDDATYLPGSLDTTGTTGTVVDNGDGTFDYTPAPAFAGDDSFTYEICDDDVPTATCDTATVTVTVVDEGDPDANDDTATAAEEATTATVIDAIGNDTLTDDATYLAGSLDTTGTVGTVVDNGDGTFDYTPAPAFAGDDSFTYEICDDDTPATCDTAMVTVTVIDEGSPDAIDDTANVVEDTATATVIDAIGNDTLTDDATYLAGSLDTTGTAGTVVDNGDGTFDYTPAPGFSGDDSFTYTICDDDTPTATCDTATVTVTVIDEGEPDATDDTANVVEDTATATVIDAIGNDTLTDDATYLAGSLDTTGTTGTVVDNGDGTFDYTPAPGFAGDDSFTYEICDDDTPTATCDTATVTVTVIDEGDPDAIDDTANVLEDTPTATVIDAIANDTLTDDATYLAGSLDTTGTAGTVVDNGDGTFDYTPAPGFSGDDTFTYEICDDDTPTATCDTATVTVTVGDQGDPDAIDDAVSIIEDTTTPTVIDAIGNDFLIDNAMYETGSLDTTGTFGTVVDNGDGTFDYTPAAGFVGDDTFTYEICDDDTPIPTCDTATVTVTVVDEGSPDAVDDAVSIAEDTITATVIDAIANDTLTDDATYLAGSLDTTGTFGTVVDNGDGTFDYTPAPGFAGIDTFTYEICDDDTPIATCDTANVTVTVADEGAPDAVDDTATVSEGATVATVIDAIGNDTLTDDATYLAGSLDTTGTFGTVGDNGDGTFDYTPAAAFAGDDSFTYAICDDDTPTATCDTATVTVTVIDEGDPDANDDTATVSEGATVATVIDAIGNDTLTDDATYLAGSLDTTGTFGTVGDNGDGTFDYTPPPAFAGDDTFTYTICDDDTPIASCDTATVTVTVVDEGDPDAIDDTASVTEDTTTATVIDAIGNDTLTDDATYLAGSLDVTGTVGTVVDNGDGTFEYTPPPAFAGDDSFTYEICDDDTPAATCDTATVTVTVTDEGDPDATDDNVGIAEDTTTPTVIDAIGNDALTDDATYLAGSLDVTGTVGTVVDNGDGTFDYTPPPAFVGVDTFTYEICDDDTPAATCDTATVTVTVTDEGDPDAIDDTASVTEDTTTVTVIDAIGNDTLTDDATYLAGSLDVTGTVGTVVDNGDGTFDYTPAPGFAGDDSFTYAICDDDTPAATCDTATVTVTVTDEGDPDAIDDTATVSEGATVATVIDAIGNDTLTDDATYLAGSLDVTGTVGTVVDNGDGTFDYTPAPGFAGDDSFTYAICDDDTPIATCDTATVTVTVVDEGDPDAIDDTASVTEDTTTATVIDAIGNDTLTDDATYLAGSLDVTGTVGTVVDNGDGTFDYTPPPAFAGDDSFTYAICDDDTPIATCDTATVTVAVVDEGDPDAIDDTASVTEDTTTATVIDAIGNDTLTDDATYLAGSLDVTGTVGTVVDNGDGTFDYTPAPGFAGDDSFTYAICDDDTPIATCDTATVTVTVTDEGDPDAIDDTASVVEDSPATVIDAIGNDTLTDDATYLAGSLDVTGTVGTVGDNGDGTFDYTPAPGFVGVDTFTYAICDDDTPIATCDTATVTVTVTDEGDPDAIDDTASVVEDSLATVIDAIGNDTLTDDATYLAGSLDVTGTVGTVGDNGDGTFDYTPAPGFVGVDTFTYAICDDDTPIATCDTATVTVTVTDEGDPDAIDDTASVVEDSLATVIDAIGNDTLTDDATYLAGSLDVTGTVGTVGDNGDGTFDYTPAPGFVGVDTFTYAICDDDTPAATCDTATVTVTVTDEGDPDAIDDTVLIDEGTTTVTVIDAIGNDTLADDATYLAGSLDVTGTLGTVVDNGDGTFDYTPAAAFTGDDTFTYAICDDDTPIATCDTATVTVTVSDEGDPDAIDDTASVVEDTATATVIDAIGNDTLTDDATYLAGSLDTTGTVGTVGDNGDGTFDYTPAAGFVGVDTFTYTICDDDTPIATCDTATVTVTVTDEGSPDAIDDTASVVEDSPATVIDAIGNDDLADDATYLPGSLDVTGTVGTVVDNGDGTFDYTPAAGFVGVDTFTYAICDDDTPTATCDTATVTVTVTDEGDPDAIDDTASVTEDTTTATVIDAIGNDTLTDDATYLAGSLDTTGTVGTVVDNGDGTFDYTPPPAFAGDDSFTYAICDDDTPIATCDTATVTVTVVDEGDPDAIDDTASVVEDSPATLIDAIGNDTLTDDATYLAGSLDTTGTVGTVGDNGDGTFDYTPAAGFVGVDTFTYTICDDDTPTATCDTATVTVTVSDEGDPDAIDDTASVVEDTTTATVIDAIGNDTLTDDATYLAGSLDTTGTVGTVGDNGDGTFDYTPAPGFAGDDSFTYAICDDDTPTATCDTATVTVTVTDEGDPDAIDDTASVVEDTTTATVIDAIGNDTLTDDATYLAGSLDTTGTVGTVGDNGDGTFDYTPAPGFVGVDSFTYAICDDDTPIATCDTATVTVTVVDEGDPDAIDDTASVVEDSPATVIDAIGNDDLTDDATYLAGSLDVTGTLGTVVDNGDGTFDYTPAAGFAGDDTFTYAICDDDTPTATCDTATVTVTVVDEGDPDAIDDTASVIEDTTTVTLIDAIGNDTLTDDATYLAGSLDVTGTVGTVGDNGDGTFDYTPAPGFVGDDTFTYTICDDDTPTATCDTATVTVTVSDEGDPDAIDDTASVIEDSPATLIDAIGNDTLTDDATYLAGSLDVTGTVGTVGDNGDGTFDYTPAAGFVGVDTFTYAICDDDTPTATCDTATVTVTVTDEGDPDAIDDSVSVDEDATTATMVDAIGNDTLTDDATYLAGSLDVTGTVGTVGDNGDGTFDYTPAAGFVGVDTFTYTICDDDTPTATCDTATVTVTVSDEGDPDAIDDSVSVDEDATTATMVDAIGNDTLTDDATYLAGSLDTTGTVGTVGDNGDGTFDYTPAPGFSGVDTFTYTICDDDTPIATCDTATVTITVTDEGSPDAIDDAVTVTEDSPATLIDAIGNDTLTDSATYLAGSLDTTGAAGVVFDNGDGTFVYTPAPGFVGDDTFTYTICDNDTPIATCDTATVTVTVTDEGSPDAIDDAVTVTEDSPTTVIDAIGNDTLTDDATYLAGSLDTTGTVGTVVDNGDGTFDYTPAPGFFGTDTFTYAICDDDAPTATCDTATVTVTVTPSDAPPIAVDDTASTINTPVAIPLLANDTDPDGGTISVDSFTQPANGTVSVDPATGVATYTPDAGFVGVDTFTYVIIDEDGRTATATVTVTVGNGPPDFGGDEPAKLTIKVGGGLSPVDATDPNGDDLTYTLVAGGLPTGITLNADGTFSGSATATGVFTFTIEACDDRVPALCDRLVLEVTVEPATSLPTSGGSTELPLKLSILVLAAGVLLLAISRRPRSGLIARG